MSVGPVFSLSGAASSAASEAGSVSGAGGAFGRLVQDFLASTGRAEAAVDQSVKDLALGKTSDFHQIAMTTARADLNFRFILEVRNRLIEAYQEVMRMQI